MFYVCDCGFSATTSIEKSTLLCIKCNTSLTPKDNMPLTFYSHREFYFELNKEDLNINQKLIYEFIKSHPDCRDKDIEAGTKLPINIITGRRWDLANCSIPLIYVSGMRKIKYPNKEVTVKVWKAI